MAWPTVLLFSLILIQDPPAPAARPAAAAVSDKPAAAAVSDKPAVAAAPATAEGPQLKAAPGATAKPAPAAPAAAPAAGGEGGLGMLVYLGPIILLFYLMIIRPQRQQESKHKQLLNALKKNDKVQTSAGIYGTVVSTDPTSDKVVVRVDDDKGIKLTFSKASIVRVIEPQTEKAADSSS